MSVRAGLKGFSFSCCHAVGYCNNELLMLLVDI